MKTLKEIFKERCINVAAFSREFDIPPTTLYSVISGQNEWQKMSIQAFIKVAHGLGMTADELIEVLDKWDSER